MCLNICQILIGILGHVRLASQFPPSAWLCFPSAASASLSQVWIERVSASDISLPLSSVLFSLLSVGAQTEMKKVVGDNATLPCHHQFPSSGSLDIEWLLQKPNSKQNVVSWDSFFFHVKGLKTFIEMSLFEVLQGNTLKKRSCLFNCSLPTRAA